MSLLQAPEANAAHQLLLSAQTHRAVRRSAEIARKMGVKLPSPDVHVQAARESCDGHARHVVYSPTWGPRVFTSAQASAFLRQVHIDATFLFGKLIGAAEVVS